MKNFVLMAAVVFMTQFIENTPKDVLTYSEPSKEWMGSLPLGNGRLGTMVYGGTDSETIALNEVTIWSGKPDPDANNICGADNLKKMRDAFFRGDVAEGNRLGQANLNGHGHSFGTNLPFGDIIIKNNRKGGTVSDYSRKLMLDDAMAKISYKENGIKYVHEYFCSNPAQVFVARFSASGKANLDVSILMRMLRHGTVKANGNQLEIDGDARFDKNGEGGVKFHSVVRVIADGGKISAQGDRLNVEGANSFIIIADVRTDFNNPDYVNLCNKTVDSAASQAYSRLKALHKKDFSSLYDRMDIDLGGKTVKNETTDMTYRRARKGDSNPVFDALFFKYGRYMLISSSRENSPLPAHLQGIWNDNLACNMPWTCDYHLDINIQQNYWSANIANLHECNTPLFSYIDMLSKYGNETARKMYGCDGWVAHTINNVWGATYPGDGLGWSMNVTAGAWLATQLWTNYDFTRDKEYLRTVGYPLLKKTAQFFVDYMVKDPNTGYLVTGPSISPENGFRMSDGSGYSLSMMPTIDRAVVYDIYNSCIESSRILNVDSDFRARLEHDIKLLPPLRVGKNGALMEWLLDVERQDPAHRHASHLLALYPFGQISPVKTPDLAKGCERFLYLQTHNGAWEDNEWSRGNMINFYARLKIADEAYKSLIGLYTGFMRENLMTVSPAGVAGAESDIFSFDATEAAVAGICEMILQSYDGYLDFLPALPKEWNDGSIRGICARGGIIADIDWKKGRVTRAVLRSNTDQTVSCKINGIMKNVVLKAGKAKSIR